MSVIVKGLADTVRRAKASVDRAGKSAAKLNASAADLTSVVNQVDSMSAELDAARAELQGALGGMTNGGPAMDDLHAEVKAGLDAGQTVPDVRAAVVKVGAANK